MPRLKIYQNSSMAIYNRFREQQFNLTKSFLKFWLSPTFIRNSLHQLNLQADEAVCYVMDYQSIADLMVTEIACEQGNLPLPRAAMTGLPEARSFFFLRHATGMIGRKTAKNFSPRLERLLSRQRQRTQSIKVVPISLFWGHQPDKEKSWLKLMLSDNWSATSRIRKILALLLVPKHLLVEFGEPVDLLSINRAQDNPALAARHLHRKLRTHFTQQRQAILGPDLSHRRTLLKTITESDRVRAAVIDASISNQEPQTETAKRAEKYAREIASDQSYRVIRFFEVFLSWLWNKLYEGIEIYNLDRAKAAALTSEVVYVPCHRSHIDYLLLSYVLYHNGLTPPHIAAGVNLNLPLLGSLLRRGGAFFMRRTFKEDLLYKTVFDEYLHLMLSKGHSIEYFIEGGRSRTGSMLNPRIGMISMTLNGYYKDNSKELTFMPVYFSYEKVMEINSYIGELAGRKKNKETLTGLFTTLKLLKQDFGQVAVSFGKPLNLRSYLSEHQPDWHTHLPADINRKTSISLAHELSQRINDAAVLNTVNITAFAILCTQRNAIEMGRLESQIAFLLRVSASQLKTSLLSQAPKDIIENAIRITGLAKSTSAAGTTIKADPANHIVLRYYYNNVIHLFTIPSLTARILRHRSDLDYQTLLNDINLVLPFITNELLIKNNPMSTSAGVDQLLSTLETDKLIFRQQNQLNLRQQPIQAYLGLYDLGDAVSPFLIRYYIVCYLLDFNLPSRVEIENAALSIYQQVFETLNNVPAETMNIAPFSAFLKELVEQGWLDSEQSTDGREVYNLQQFLASLLAPDILATVASCSNTLLHKNIESTASPL